MKKHKAKQFVKIFEKAKNIKEFDMDLYYILIEKIVVFEDKMIIVGLLDGSEIEVLIK